MWKQSRLSKCGPFDLDHKLEGTTTTQHMSHQKTTPHTQRAYNNKCFLGNFQKNYHGITEKSENLNKDFFLQPGVQLVPDTGFTGATGHCIL